jgi:hypothetical protein
MASHSKKNKGIGVATPQPIAPIWDTRRRSARNGAVSRWCTCVEKKGGNHGKGRRCWAPAFAQRAPDHTAAASLFAPPPETVPALAPVTPPAVEPTPVAEEATQHPPDATMPAPELGRDRSKTQRPLWANLSGLRSLRMSCTVPWVSVPHSHPGHGATVVGLGALPWEAPALSPGWGVIFPRRLQ